MLLGLIIGVASGALQFWMLARFTKAVTGGGFGKKAVIFGICQFFLPLVVLLVCAFLLSGALLWAAVGMIAALVIPSFTRFMIKKK